jgi:hypothetical protein
MDWSQLFLAFSAAESWSGLFHSAIDLVIWYVHMVNDLPLPHISRHECVRIPQSNLVVLASKHSRSVPGLDGTRPDSASSHPSVAPLVTGSLELDGVAVGGNAG